MQVEVKDDDDDRKIGPVQGIKRKRGLKLKINDAPVEQEDMPAPRRVITTSGDTAITSGFLSPTISMSQNRGYSPLDFPRNSCDTQYKLYDYPLIFDQVGYREGPNVVAIVQWVGFERSNITQFTNLLRACLQCAITPTLQDAFWCNGWGVQIFERLPQHLGHWILKNLNASSDEVEQQFQRWKQGIVEANQMGKIYTQINPWSFRGKDDQPNSWYLIDWSIHLAGAQTDDTKQFMTNQHAIQKLIDVLNNILQDPSLANSNSSSSADELFCELYLRFYGVGSIDVCKHTLMVLQKVNEFQVLHDANGNYLPLMTLKELSTLMRVGSARQLYSVAIEVENHRNIPALIPDMSPEELQQWNYFCTVINNESQNSGITFAPPYKLQLKLDQMKCLPPLDIESMRNNLCGFLKYPNFRFRAHQNDRKSDLCIDDAPWKEYNNQRLANGDLSNLLPAEPSWQGLEVTNILGHGAFGVVLKLDTVNSQSHHVYPLAVKIAKLEHQGGLAVQMARREYEFSKRASELYLAPPVQLHTFWTKQTNADTTLTFSVMSMKMLSSTLKQFLSCCFMQIKNQTMSADEWKIIWSTICSALVQMLQKLFMLRWTHGDLYFRNIIFDFTHDKSQVLQAIDFGMCSSKVYLPECDIVALFQSLYETWNAVFYEVGDGTMDMPQSTSSIGTLFLWTVDAFRQAVLPPYEQMWRQHSTLHTRWQHVWNDFVEWIVDCLRNQERLSEEQRSKSILWIYSSPSFIFRHRSFVGLMYHFLYDDTTIDYMRRFRLSIPEDPDIDVAWTPKRSFSTKQLEQSLDSYIAQTNGNALVTADAFLH